MKGGKLNIQGGKIFNTSQADIKKNQGFMFNQHSNNVTRLGLKQLQQRLSITETTSDIIASTTTSIPINATVSDIIKTKDKLLIVNPVTGVATSITASSDVKGTDTTLSIVSSTIYAPTGSFIMFSEDWLNYFVRGGTITLKHTILNSAYKTLDSSPVTLVSGSPGLVMIPIGLTIITDGYVNDDEGNNRTLYLGHSTTTTSGTFWDKLTSFNYRQRNNSTWAMLGEKHSSGKIFNSSISGQPIKLYSSGSFESDDFSLIVYLTYRIDSE